MDNDELQSELDRLWGRVSRGPEAALPPGSAPASSFGDMGSLTREVSLEAISMLKRQHRQETERLAQLLELKEQSLRQVTDRLRSAEAEVQSMRRRLQADDERLMQEMAGVSAELENAHRMVSQQEERYREEEKILRSIVEASKQQLAAEKARMRELETSFNEREQEYLLEIRELQARSEKSSEEAAKNEGRHRRSLQEITEAKAAIEATLTELLKERTSREESDRERDTALKRVKEVEEHFKELQNLWTEERAQWQELWDRERSSWQSQRKEFKDWEDKVRAERQTWHSQLKTLEGREVKYTEQMTEILRRSTGAAEKVTGLMNQVALKMKELALGKVQLDSERRRVVSWRYAGALAAVLAVVSAGYTYYKYSHRLRLEATESHILVAGHPTALTFDGASLWLSEWDGRLSLLDPADPAQVLRRVRVDEKIDPYHPISLAQWGDKVYSLDSAQGRIIRHSADEPEKIDGQWKSPGPAPIALAHDGQNLWSYDAATKALYRHLGDGAEAQAEAFKIEFDILPTAMAWFKGELWAYDSKSRSVMVFKTKGKAVDLTGKSKLDTPLAGLSVVYRSDSAGRQRVELWGLAVPDSGAEAQTLKKYRVLR